MMISVKSVGLYGLSQRQQMTAATSAATVVTAATAARNSTPCPAMAQASAPKRHREVQQEKIDPKISKMSLGKAWEGQELVKAL